MPLDRQSIERRDFPVGSRGYDPDAVDSHLAAVADEVAAYKQAARRRADTLAAAASEQVRAIVEAAESSAAEIQRQAETQAQEIRDEASKEAGAIRGQARDYVTRVSGSADSMIGRLDAIEHELRELVESLRSGGGRFRDGLRALEDDLAGLSAAVSPRPRFEPEPAPEPARGGPPEAVAQPVPEPEAQPVPESEAQPVPESEAQPAPESEAQPVPESEVQPEPAAEAEPPAYGEWEHGGSEPIQPEAAGTWGVLGAPAPEHSAPAYGGERPVAGVPTGAASAYGYGASPGVGEPEHEYTPPAEQAPATAEPEYTYDPDNPDPLPDEGDEAEGARLIALNMALNGTPREETARYLSENFQLVDAGGLLDEVYASVEG